jgi:uncharacterized membrane protein
MEAFGVLFALVLIGVVIILPIWVISAVLNLRRRAESDRQQSNQHWQGLTIRVHLLETHLKEMKQVRAASPEESHEAREPKPPTPAAAVPAEVSPPLVRPVPPPVPAALSPDIPRPEPQRPAAAPPPSIPQRPATSQPRPITPPRTQPPSYPTPAVHQPARRSGLDLEEVLGTNWLNKIGIGILVLGLAFFLAYQLQNLGPAGKVFLGVGLSAAMVAVGVRYESNERYRILARASAAGGWALLYFVSYAVYHVPAARVIDSRQFDFFLMLSVAAAIVAYSLRYKSQATTAGVCPVLPDRRNPSHIVLQPRSQRHPRCDRRCPRPADEMVRARNLRHCRHLLQSLPVGLAGH